MILPKVSNDFIGIFLKNMNNIEETKLTSKNKRIMREFYNLLKKFDINLDNTKQISIEKTIVDINNKKDIINKYTFLNDQSIFLSRNIQNLVKTKLCYLYTFKINIGSIFFTTNIFVFFTVSPHKNVTKYYVLNVFYVRSKPTQARPT